MSPTHWAKGLGDGDQGQGLGQGQGDGGDDPRGASAQLFVHHDSSRVRLHPYEFIYVPFVDDPWQVAYCRLPPVWTTPGWPSGQSVNTELVSSVVIGVYITVSNTAFRHIALKLTDWENHRTDPQ